MFGAAKDFVLKSKSNYKAGKSSHSKLKTEMN